MRRMRAAREFSRIARTTDATQISSAITQNTRTALVNARLPPFFPSSLLPAFASRLARKIEATRSTSRSIRTLLNGERTERIIRRRARVSDVEDRHRSSSFTVRTIGVTNQRAGPSSIEKCELRATMERILYAGRYVGILARKIARIYVEELSIATDVCMCVCFF